MEPLSPGDGGRSVTDAGGNLWTCYHRRGRFVTSTLAKRSEISEISGSIKSGSSVIRNDQRSETGLLSTDFNVLASMRKQHPAINSQIPKIVSGGKTGADRAALDWALFRGIVCGGWCPKGRKAEDGRINAKYPLVETPSAAYVQRTELNVRDTGGTVIFSIERELTGGSKKTLEFAVKHNKPLLHLYPPGIKDAAEKLRDFKGSWLGIGEFKPL